MSRRPGHQAWTDDRLDEFTRRTDENFERIEAGIERRRNIFLSAIAGGFIAVVGTIATHFLG
jgi:hypothetical protein